jgi:hypothetical protein
MTVCSSRLPDINILRADPRGSTNEWLDSYACEPLLGLCFAHPEQQSGPILAKHGDICLQWGRNNHPQLELGCLLAYRMTSLGLASLLAYQQFGNAVLDELHKRFGWIPLYDHMNHSVEDHKVWIELEEGVYDSVGQLVQFARCVRVLLLSYGRLCSRPCQRVVIPISLLGRSPRGSLLMRMGRVVEPRNGGSKSDA